MGRKKERVRYDLDSSGISKLTDDEIKAVLRAADEIIAIGGRSMLAKILKGSKDKKVLEHELNLCPTYGFYMELTLAEITNRIDWMIQKDYLEIEYRDRLPLLVFSEKGWDIEKENCTEELLQKFTILLEGKDYSFIQQLKDKNRGMILLFIEKIKQTGNARFIPILKVWKEIEYKKVQAEIQRVIDYLMKEGTIF